MITEMDAKNKAGVLFVDYYGRGFVRKNISRLGTGIIKKKGTIQVDFELFEKDIETYPTLFEANDEEHYGDVIFSVLVDLKTGSTQILN